MLKLYALSFFCSLISFCCIAQSKTTDSLKIVLDQHKERDTITAINLYYYGFALSKTNNNAAVQYVKQATELAKELKWNDGWIGGLLGLSGLYSFQNKYDSAILIALEVLKASEE